MLSAKLKEKIGLLLPQTLSALIGFLPAISAALFDSLGLAKLIETQSPEPFAKAALWLSALLLWLLAYMLHNRPRYQFFPELGLKGNLDKGLFLCPKCQNPLRIEKHQFHCITCEKDIALPNKETVEMVANICKQNAYL